MVRPGTLRSDSQTPAGTLLHNSHTQKHPHASRREKSFQVKVQYAYMLCCLLRLFSGTNTVTASPPCVEATKGKCPLRYVYPCQTITQVKPLMVVDKNGSVCVIQHDFVTLLLTRVGQSLMQNHKQGKEYKLCEKLWENDGVYCISAVGVTLCSL